jgi:hypothetical protein
MDVKTTQLMDAIADRTAIWNAPLRAFFFAAVDFLS